MLLRIDFPGELSAILEAVAADNQWTVEQAAGNLLCYEVCSWAGMSGRLTAPFEAVLITGGVRLRLEKIEPAPAG